MNALSKLPIVGSKSMNKNLEKMLKVYLTFYTASKRIEWIETGNWKFLNQKIIDIIPMLDKQEQFEFDCDPRNIDWKQYIRDYCIGLQIYVSGQDMPEEKHGFTQLLSMNKDMLDDVKESFKAKEGLRARPYIDEKRIIDD